MKNIRDINTRGLELYEREELYNKVEPIEIGSAVYESGGFCGNVKKLIVTKENQKHITMFWNSMYFDNYDDAEKDTNQRYRDYINSRW